MTVLSGSGVRRTNIVSQVPQSGFASEKYVFVCVCPVLFGGNSVSGVFSIVSIFLGAPPPFPTVRDRSSMPRCPFGSLSDIPKGGGHECGRVDKTLCKQQACPPPQASVSSRRLARPGRTPPPWDNARGGGRPPTSGRVEDPPAPLSGQCLGVAQGSQGRAYSHVIPSPQGCRWKNPNGISMDLWASVREIGGQNPSETVWRGHAKTFPEPFRTPFRILPEPFRNPSRTLLEPSQKARHHRDTVKT